jgi:hypothetical protein
LADGRGGFNGRWSAIPVQVCNPRRHSRWHHLRDAKRFDETVIRWCRRVAPQPPANVCHPCRDEGKQPAQPAPRSRYVSASPVGWVANGRTLIFVGQPVIHWRTHHAARSRPTALTIHLATNLLYPGGMIEISRWLSASDTTGSDAKKEARGGHSSFEN